MNTSEEKRRAWMRGPGAGDLIDIVGDRYRVLARHGETDGAYTLIDALVAPGGGPPPHIHSREEEGFYILEGEMAFYSDGERMTAGPGAFVHLPKGSAHRFANETDAPVRSLMFIAPGGLEDFFTECGATPASLDAPVSAFGDTDIAKILAAAPRYGLTIQGPEG